MNILKPLSNAEYDIMRIVWTNDQPITALQILERLKDVRSWSLQTLYTALSRLESKHFMLCNKKGRNKSYVALMTEEEYKQLESKSFLNRVYSNSVKNMVASLYQGNALSDKDIHDLKKFLENIGRDDV